MSVVKLEFIEVITSILQTTVERYRADGTRHYQSDQDKLDRTTFQGWGNFPTTAVQSHYSVIL